MSADREPDGIMKDSNQAAGRSAIQRWFDLAGKRTNLAAGIAPSSKWLLAWGLPDTLSGAELFCESMLPVASQLSAVKLQSVFFERFGPDGLRLMAEFTAACRADTVVIIDAKRGDAEDTAQAYCDLYLGPGSRVGGDMLTVLPFMGFSAAVPLCELAAARGCAVMVLIRTSNHAGGIQTVEFGDGRTVSAALADEINEFNLRTGASPGPVAALVGAPSDEARALLARLPSALVSMPGLGRPGRTLAEFAQAIGAAAPRVLLPVTSGILSAGPVGLADRVAQWQQELREHGLAS